MLLLLAIELMVTGCSHLPDHPIKTPLNGARQMIIVTATDWNSSSGVMRLYERQDASSAWHQVFHASKVSIGRNGLAWGVGLHEIPEGVTTKREGDGRSPAGVFRLGTAFGYASSSDPTVTGLRLSYIQATDNILCVDDSSSKYYNKIIDQSQVAGRDWNSSERMKRADDLYQLGIVVEHNSLPAISQGGSCIFMHLWVGSEVSTSGCTAFDIEAMKSLLTWLDATAEPVLVQLPEYELWRLKGIWGLP